MKKAEHQRIDVFELWYWRRLLKVPWTARKSNQSILKEISPEYSLEGLRLKQKLQSFGAAAKSLQSCRTLCDPIDGSPPCQYRATHVIRYPNWKKHKLESRLLGGISITSDMQMTPPLWQKVKN